MSKKQTAVQWLEKSLKENIKQIVLNLDADLMESLFEQALRMEREQIEEAYKQGDEDGFHSTESQSDYELEGRSSYLASQYYTQTYE